MAKLIVFLIMVIALLGAWYSREKAVNELEQLKQAVAANSEKAQLQSKIDAQALALQALTLERDNATQIISIDERFKAALSELELSPFDVSNGVPSSNTSASPDGVPDATSVTSAPKPSSSTKSFGASNELYQAKSRTLEQKLSSCEVRLLYEAREYDTLATHYQTLLAIYNNAQEKLDEYRKDQAR